MNESVCRWLDCDRAPADFYELLGRSRFDPDRGEVLKTIRAANRELMHYQNHRDQDMVRRAMRLQLELAKAEDTFNHPEKLSAYQDLVVARLRDEYLRVAEEIGADVWDPSAVRTWLDGTQNVHPGRLDAAAHAVLSPEADTSGLAFDDAPVTLPAGDSGFLSPRPGDSGFLPPLTGGSGFLPPLRPADFAAAPTAPAPPLAARYLPVASPAPQAGAEVHALEAAAAVVDGAAQAGVDVDGASSLVGRSLLQPLPAPKNPKPAARERARAEQRARMLIAIGSVAALLVLAGGLALLFTSGEPDAEAAGDQRSQETSEAGGAARDDSRKSAPSPDAFGLAVRNATGQPGKAVTQKSITPQPRSTLPPRTGFTPSPFGNPGSGQPSKAPPQPSDSDNDEPEENVPPDDGMPDGPQGPDLGAEQDHWSRICGNPQPDQEETLAGTFSGMRMDGPDMIVTVRFRDSEAMLRGQEPPPDASLFLDQLAFGNPVGFTCRVTNASIYPPEATLVAMWRHGQPETEVRFAATPLASTPTLQFKLPGGRLIDLAWSPDGTRLAAVGESVIVSDAIDGRVLKTLPFASRAQRVLWSADGAYLAAQSSNAQIIIWHAATWRQVVPLPNETFPAGQFAWGPRNDDFAIVQGSTLTVGKAGQRRSQTLVLSNPKALAWSPDGTQILCHDRLRTPFGGSEEFIGFVPTQARGLGQFSPLVRADDVDQIWAFNQNGQLTLVAKEDDWINVWYAAKGTSLPPSPFRVNVRGSFGKNSFDSRGNRLAVVGDRVAGSDSEIAIHDVRGGSTQNLRLAPNASVTLLAWSPVADLLAHGDRRGPVVIWNASEESKLIELRAGRIVNVLAWRPDGVQLAVGSADGTIDIWDVPGQTAPDVRDADDAEPPSATNRPSPAAQKIGKQFKADLKQLTSLRSQKLWEEMHDLLKRLSKRKLSEDEAAELARFEQQLQTTAKSKLELAERIKDPNNPVRKQRLEEAVAIDPEGESGMRARKLLADVDAE